MALFLKYVLIYTCICDFTDNNLSYEKYVLINKKMKLLNN